MPKSGPSVLPANAGLPPLTAKQARFFLTIVGSFRNKQKFFQELSDPRAFVDVREVLETFHSSLIFKSTQKSDNKLMLKEKRIPISVAVVLALNAEACQSSPAIGVFRHSWNTAQERAMPIFYAHREWQPGKKELYQRSTPADKQRLDSALVPFHWPSALTDVLCILLLLPAEWDGKPEADRESIRYSFTSMSPADRHPEVALIWTGSRLLCASMAQLLAGQQKSVGWQPSPEFSNKDDAMPVFVRKAPDKTGCREVEWFFFPQSASCCAWADEVALAWDGAT